MSIEGSSVRAAPIRVRKQRAPGGAGGVGVGAAKRGLGISGLKAAWHFMPFYAIFMWARSLPPHSHFPIEGIGEGQELWIHLCVLRPTPSFRIDLGGLGFRLFGASWEASFVSFVGAELNPPFSGRFGAG